MQSFGTVETILRDIIDQYARGEILAESLDGSRKNYKQELNNIKVGYCLNNKEKKIKEYAAHSIRKNVNDQREGSGRYDWDTISFKDKKAYLLEHISDYLLADDKITKAIESIKILKIIEDNVIRYFENEFNDKTEDMKDYYQQYGNFDLMESF